MKSTIERLMSYQIVASDLERPDSEYRFHPIRKWRFDFAWPKRKIALEIEGGTATNGRHVRQKGFQDDCEKYNAAALMGWRVFRVTTEMVNAGYALRTMEEALNDKRSNDEKADSPRMPVKRDRKAMRHMWETFSAKYQKEI